RPARGRRHRRRVGQRRGDAMFTLNRGDAPAVPGRDRSFPQLLATTTIGRFDSATGRRRRCGLLRHGFATVVLPRTVAATTRPSGRFTGSRPCPTSPTTWG